MNVKSKFKHLPSWTKVSFLNGRYAFFYESKFPLNGGQSTELHKKLQGDEQTH